MDISARPKQFKVSDFQKINLSSESGNALSNGDLENSCTVLVGSVNEKSEIFVFSLTCPFSEKIFITQIVPMIKSGKSLIMANFIRNDYDLNIWVRLAKIKSAYRMAIVSALYKYEFDGHISTEFDGQSKNYNDIQKTLDKILSNVPIDKVNSSYTPEHAAISSLVTTAALNQLYGVTTTPYIGNLK
ncbi:hypothetical protein [Enterobacter asburiae]|uniref:hypothetical protein n=1 Tax=Enterobacter asburiae TaxID=61645 RepID=UPI002A818371|nr:hypothetical protein [Enterobacter asburiae]